MNSVSQPHQGSPQQNHHPNKVKSGAAYAKQATPSFNKNGSSPASNYSPGGPDAARLSQTKAQQALNPDRPVLRQPKPFSTQPAPQSLKKVKTGNQAKPPAARAQGANTSSQAKAKGKTPLVSPLISSNDQTSEDFVRINSMQVESVPGVDDFYEYEDVFEPGHYSGHPQHNVVQIPSMKHHKSQQQPDPRLAKAKGYDNGTRVMSPKSGATHSTALPNDSTNPQPAPTSQTEEGQPGTFEMGYITFFPKNNDQNFQTIPETTVADPPPPPMRKTSGRQEAAATNGWTKGDVSTGKESAALSPRIGSGSGSAIEDMGGKVKGKPLPTSSQIAHKNGVKAKPTDGPKAQVIPKHSSSTVGTGSGYGISVEKAKPRAPNLHKKGSNNSSALCQQQSPVHHNEDILSSSALGSSQEASHKQGSGFTMVPRRKILFLAENESKELDSPLTPKKQLINPLSYLNIASVDGAPNLNSTNDSRREDQVCMENGVNIVQNQSQQDPSQGGGVDQEQTAQKQQYLERQVEKILKRKPGRTSSEPAKKSRKVGVGGVDQGQRGSGAGAKKNGQAPAHAQAQGSASKFHPANADSSVVSFINEKPGTSDINQPSNRKIRVNRKLQRNGTTDTGAFRSSYYNQIRNNDDYIADADAAQESSRHNDQSAGQVYRQTHQTFGQEVSSEAAAVPQLQSVETPKRGNRRQEATGLSTSKGKRMGQGSKKAANSSTIEVFDGFDASLLSNERIRMTSNTQESTLKYAYGGNRSNISEINEADFSANLKSDYSVSSPKEGVVRRGAGQANGLPSIKHQMVVSSDTGPHGGPHHNLANPPTSSYSNNTQKHQKRYGGGAGSSSNFGAMTAATATDATTMASQLESNKSNVSNKMHTSKFSTYDDVGVLSNHNANAVNAGSNFNYAAAAAANSQIQKQLSVGPQTASQRQSQHAQQHQLYTNGYPVGVSNDLSLLNDSIQKTRNAPKVFSPTPLQHKSSAMYFQGQKLTQGGGATTPSILTGNQDGGDMIYEYKDILDEPFGSSNSPPPRQVMVKQSQPLLSKNSFMNYLNETTSELPLSPKRRHMKFTQGQQPQATQQPTTANSVYMQKIDRQSAGAQQHSYAEKFQQHLSQQAMSQGAGAAGGSTSFQNIRADEIIKKYHHHSNTDAQKQQVFSARGPGTVSPRQIDFDRNIGTAAGVANSSFMSASDTLMNSANMSIGSSRQQTHRGVIMENMLQKIRNAVVSPPSHLMSPTGGAEALSHYQSMAAAASNFVKSPRTTQLTPLNHPVSLMGGSVNEVPTGGVGMMLERQEVESRQSQVCRQVIEEFAQKYSTIDKKRGSINPRRQNPIVRQPVSKRQASRAADCQLSPRLPDCFLMGPNSANTSMAANTTPSQIISQAAVDDQRGSAPMSHSPVSRRQPTLPTQQLAATVAAHHQQSLYNGQQNSQLSHISAKNQAPSTAAPAGALHQVVPYPQHSLVSTGNSIMQSAPGSVVGSPTAQEMHHLQLLQSQTQQQVAQYR